MNPGVKAWTERRIDDHNRCRTSLIRDLTAHRTLGLRLTLSEQPEVASLPSPMRYQRKSSIAARTPTVRLPPINRAGVPCGRYRGDQSG